MTTTSAKTGAHTDSSTTRAEAALERLGVFDHPRAFGRGSIDIERHQVTDNPSTGEPLAGIAPMSHAEYDATIERARAAFEQWRLVPAPRRGEIVRLIGEKLRAHKADLGAIITAEVGKIVPEAEGEVQECIDVADFAVGLSRQLYGLTMGSERPDHRLFEQWLPLGPVGVITAFNFPIAVYCWNALVAAVCGDTIVWKPSMAAPLTAIATTNLVRSVMTEQDVWSPDGDVDAADVFQLLLGEDSDVAVPLTGDRRVPLISATGSCAMGRAVGEKVAARLGRCLLELGGNNAAIVMPDAEMDLAARGVTFAAVGTAGQRCTTTRRLLCVGDAADRIVPKLVEAYHKVSVGDPADSATAMGPLISSDAVLAMQRAIENATEAGGEVLAGGLPGIEKGWSEAGNFVEPTIIRFAKSVTDAGVPEVVLEETFAPILYVMEFDTLAEAIAAQNGVDQGLSSAIFTDSVRSAERFLSPAGSDCGIANVNVGTSGAEIGGAFGGEKDTGGGRESGSDSWKAYMRRQTCTVNYGDDLPLAQGIEFP